MRAGRRKIIDLVVALFLLAIPLAFLHASFRSPGKVNGFDRVILAISAPLQRAASWVVEGVGDAVEDYVWLVDVEDENQELRKENERLRALLADANRQARAAGDVEGLLELRTRAQAPTLAARVIATGQSPFFRVTRIVIDRGAGEVTAGMPVIAPDGVVGRIRRVYGSYADVVLAVDPALAIDVVLPRTGSRGVIRGLGADNAYTARISYLLRGEEVQTDDLVVTSGLGGVFPRDVPVGRVHKIEKSEYGMYQEVEVAPAVDFSHLSSVVVILAAPPPPDPTAGEKRNPEPAFGVVPGTMAR